MKRLITFLLSVSLMVAMCTGCTSEDTYDKGYKSGYEVGYDKGLTEGWESGEEFTRKEISYIYEDSVDSIKMEDVTAILWCYADKNSGEDISEDELREAIFEILDYYDAVEEYHHYIKTNDMFDVTDDYY